MESKKITTSDLRLGNWLYESDKSKFPMQVESIGKNWIYLDFEDNEGDVFENSDKEIYPIPLTKELYNKIEEENKDMTIPSIYVAHSLDWLQNMAYFINGKELKIERGWL